MKKRVAKKVPRSLMILILCIVLISPCTANAAPKKYIGTWHTIGSIVDFSPYTCLYKTTFKKNGTVVQVGWRNKDKGTYKIVGKNKIKAKYNKNYVYYAGWGRVRYTYTVTYTYNPSKRTLYAKYSKAFFDRCESNAVN